GILVPDRHVHRFGDHVHLGQVLRIVWISEDSRQTLGYTFHHLNRVQARNSGNIIVKITTKNESSLQVKIIFLLVGTYHPISRNWDSKMASTSSIVDR